MGAATHRTPVRSWTLELRDGVKFSDGTPVDSAAVSASLNRYVTNKGPQSSLYASKVASVDTPDASTVVFNLVDPWTGIESLLSTGPGMIVAASAQQGEQFTPIGAGASGVGARDGSRRIRQPAQRR
ncbi:ABC transporter substrate-binding protein [Rhodococcus erythropolis]|uniref:ABC transporter substrate-binding protein n=1 Tax=Rhodococcus erythropolis TaxID=1833 RepID=UPI002948C6C8|nr:ABC transporter substrate-binding protein [Rhodococcus erythropolis]MDV6274712.1 ABC transporter substrate-binding protein [Rhodococcus erythropolis]